MTKQARNSGLPLANALLSDPRGLRLYDGKWLPVVVRGSCAPYPVNPVSVCLLGEQLVELGSVIELAEHPGARCHFPLTREAVIVLRPAVKQQSLVGTSAGYLEHLFFPSFGSSLYATCWKVKFQGKLSQAETNVVASAASNTTTQDGRHHHTASSAYLGRTQALRSNSQSAGCERYAPDRSGANTSGMRSPCRTITPGTLCP